MHSYWGIDHGDVISKADRKGPSAGRLGTAVATNHLTGLPGLHAAVTGRKGKKLKAWGNQAGSQIAGGLAGFGLNAAARGRLGVAAPMTGAVGGTVYGTNRAQKKGYLKRDEGTRFR